MSIKLVCNPRQGAPVLLGIDMPKHLQVAHGRYVFRLLHTRDNPHHKGIYLRDLPLSMHDLAHCGFPHSRAAYVLECDRAHIPTTDRCL
jgi:hypothetical protein